LRPWPGDLPRGVGVNLIHGKNYRAGVALGYDLATSMTIRD